VLRVNVLRHCHSDRTINWAAIAAVQHGSTSSLSTIYGWLLDFANAAQGVGARLASDVVTVDFASIVSIVVMSGPISLMLWTSKTLGIRSV